MRWEIKSIGDLCEIFDSKRKPITKRDRIEGEIPYYGATGVLSYIDDFIFNEKLVLLGEDGAKWESGDNSSFIINGKTWVNNHAHVLKPKRNFLLDEWLVYNLNHQNLMPYVSGMTVPKLNQGNMKKIEIPIPPLSEQKQIVETLDKAFEKIDKAIANIERNIQNAEELLESKVIGIFNQNGNKWTQMTLGEIGKVSMCKRILKKETNTTGGIPFYKIGTFGKKANAYISKDTYQEYSNKYSFPKKGDILISASGTIGRRVVYDGEPAYFQDSNIVWIDNNESKILNKYLYHFYGICEWNPSKGATISRLYNDDLRRIKISFPDKVTQLELVKQVESLKKLSETLLSNYIKKLDNLKELRKSILEKAFKGELISAA